MAELVDRYVHQVGRYLPKDERAEIQAELRSLIQDQLDDRFPALPAPEDVAAVLAELGDPRQMAARYSREQYLVGPDLYPVMLAALRRGWLLFPAVVVLVRVVAAVIASPEGTLLGLFAETALTALLATLTFSAVVVGIFAALQHTGVELKRDDTGFDPLALPEVDHPGSVDRVELAFGIALGTFVALVVLYFLRVGGLTLRFDLSDPGDVIDAPEAWLVLLFVAGVSQIVLVLFALRRNRWTFGSLLMETLLEAGGAVCVYFAVFQPIYERLIADDPSRADSALLNAAPELIAAALILNTLAREGPRLVRLWGYRRQ